LPINGATGQSYAALLNGDYALEISQNGCTDTSACIAITNVAVVENSFDLPVRLYPNPTSGHLNMDLGSTLNNLQITIRTVSGQTIAVQNYRSTSKIDLMINEKPGVYLVELRSGTKTATIRIIKE
jgi:hypothetical protein